MNRLFLSECPNRNRKIRFIMQRMNQWNKLLPDLELALNAGSVPPALTMDPRQREPTLCQEMLDADFGPPCTVDLGMNTDEERGCDQEMTTWAKHLVNMPASSVRPEQV